MITFKEDTELEVIVSFDEHNDVIAEQSTEVFKAGELVDADIVDDDGESEYVDIQYADGTLTTTVQRSCFTVVE